MSSPPRLATTRFIKAYFSAVRILISYGFFYLVCKIAGSAYRERHIEQLHRLTARRIEKTIFSLQGLFIKVGQMFSVMTNVLPPALRSGLEQLQDSVPARPYEQIAAQIEKQFGRPPEQVFATFERVPVASASLGQVHIATTHQGEKVAVKVRHLNVERMATADLRTIWRILQLVKLFVRVRGLDNYYHEIRAMVLAELDFDQERRHIEEIAANFAQNDTVAFPKVYRELSGSQVLTLGYMDGIKISDTKALEKAGHDVSVISRNLLTAYCQMIFVDGRYHADPHPGNLRVLKDGRVALLDFGAVGHLSTQMREGLGTLMEAILKGDEQLLLRSLKSMGFLRIGGHHVEAATQVIEHFHRKFQEEIRVTDFSFSSIQVDTSKGFEHLSDLREMNIGFRALSDAFHVPREWVLLERTALQLTGLCSQLDPNQNPAAIIRPYLEEFVLGRDRDWSGMLFDLSRDRVLSFLSMPKLMEKYVNHALSGRLRFSVAELERASWRVYSGMQQLTFSLLGISATALGLYLRETGSPQEGRMAFYGAAFFGSLVVISIFRSGKNRR